MNAPQALLLDLDGTLLDTAPDMVGALNRLRSEQGLEPLPYLEVRPHVSHGAARLVRLGFPSVDDAQFERLRLRFLALYRESLAAGTRLFDGFAEVFAHLAEFDMPWGVVTNKPSWLTDPLMSALGLTTSASCIVSADTVAERKPHPLPLLHAARCLQVAPERCVYVGDAERDVTAGRAAGMRTLVAGWGYLAASDDTIAWGADGRVETPQELLSWLVSARDEDRLRGCVR